MARDADVTQLFWAFRMTVSPSLCAVPTGAQKWLRDPASLKARVLRCSPDAAARRTGSLA